MKYVLSFRNRNMSSCFPNGNGSVKDIVSFSNKDFYIYSTPEEAEGHKIFLINAIKVRKEEINNMVYASVISKLESMQIRNINA